MEKPLVSIIIRTCGRPHVLERALKSVKEQDYPNIEVVVIEDGENRSEELIAAYREELNICYRYTGEKSGRCRAGNLGMETASGKYLNFLDDDDRLLPCHVRILAEKLEESGCRAAYAQAEEWQIHGQRRRPEEFTVKRKLIRYKQPYNKLLLCYMNYIPIQSIMFERTLYEEFGGLDEQLDVLEDWDMWVRYSLHCDFLYVPEVTSVYYTPYKSRQKRSRESYMQKAAEAVIEKHRQYPLVLSAARINQDMDYILNVFNKKGILFYLQKVRNFFLYRDI